MNLVTINDESVPFPFNILILLVVIPFVAFILLFVIAIVLIALVVVTFPLWFPLGMFIWLLTIIF